MYYFSKIWLGCSNWAWAWLWLCIMTILDGNNLWTHYMSHETFLEPKNIKHLTNRCAPDFFSCLWERLKQLRNVSAFLQISQRPKENIWKTNQKSGFGSKIICAVAVNYWPSLGRYMTKIWLWDDSMFPRSEDWACSHCTRFTRRSRYEPTQL